MLATLVGTLVILLVACAALALGQFFGRAPVVPKCNPGPCCLEGKSQCRRRRPCASGER